MSIEASKHIFCGGFFLQKKKGTGYLIGITANLRILGPGFKLHTSRIFGTCLRLIVLT